jgi:DNA-binding GntR family transcriptional regulator
VRTEDINLYLEADRSFHRLLTTEADNARLTEMVMGRLAAILSRHCGYSTRDHRHRDYHRWP